jgi:lipid II:glycine glycyltransferase (peptidoglycan interpeptide bridge formation enzyme)
MKTINAKDSYYFNQEYFHHLCYLENARHFVAKVEDNIIGGAIFLLQNNILEYHLSASNSLGKKLSATNLLLHNAFLSAQGKGCTHAHLGGGVTATNDDPLLFFKLGFAGKLVPFKMGKYVYNQAIYRDLIAQGLLYER